MRKLLFALVATLGFGGCASMSQTPPAHFADDILVGPNEMTLYLFDKDSPGKSTCYKQCAVNWPPFFAPADAQPVGDYTIVTRDDGTTMWAYKGKPLYYWIKDQKPGDRTGEGVNKVWRVIKP